MYVWLLVAQLCQTICDPMHCSPPGSSVSGIFQAQILVVTVQLLGCVQLFATSWTAAQQASLFFTVSQHLLNLMCIESVMPSNHLILFLLSLLALSLSQHQSLF